METLDHRLDEMAGEILERIPDQDGVEGFGFKLEDRVEETGRERDVGLDHAWIAGAEDVVHHAEQVFKREAMAEADDLGYVGLREFAEVEHLPLAGGLAL